MRDLFLDVRVVQVVLFVMKKILSKIGLIVMGLTLALIMAELCLRLSDPHGGFGAARELSQFRQGQAMGDRFLVDPEFGFRPVLGTPLYNEYGTLTNAYAPARPEGAQRLLFMGDSVTARGFIVEALKARDGDATVEYWNAGVESFNTVQEVRFYERYNAPIQPDHVILSFHLNDFETTPVAFMDRRGRLVVYAPNFPVAEMNPWLFRHCRLYRFLLGLARPRNQGIDAVVDETRLALQQLKMTMDRDGIQLTVVILPFLTSLEDWSPGDRMARKLIHEILKEEGIRTLDLLPALEAAIRDGVNVREMPDDDWHPSREAAERFAGYLMSAGLLEK